MAFEFAFRAARLTPELRGWYDRVQAALITPFVRLAAWTDDDFARTVSQRYGAILAAYMATGDEGLLDVLIRLMDKAALHQLARGGDLQESMICAALALHALVMQQNGRGKLAALALERIKARYPRIPQDNLAHTYSAGIESNHYLWLLTGEAKYAEVRDAAVDVFRRHVITREDGCVWWDHRMPISPGKPGLGSPDFNYVRYTVTSVIMLHEVGITLIDPVVLAWTIATKMCNVSGLLAYSLDGAMLGKGGRVMSLDKWRSSNVALLARWNADLKEYNERAWRSGSVHVAAAQLWAG